jgi:hypothetical protein
MRITRRILAAAAVVFTISWLPAVPASAAPTMVATVSDTQDREHRLACTRYPSGPCDTRYAGFLLFNISVSNFSGSPITFGFRIEGITATPGVDVTPWAYAPPDRVTTDSNGFARVRLDMVIDQLVEPTETLRLRLTSASRPVDISDTGLGTILDHNQIPRDCSATRIDVPTAEMTCTARPTGQRWYGSFECGGFPPEWSVGNVVTGSGTSRATCVMEPWLMGNLQFRLAA